jgi:hypothetical protein
MNPQTEFQSLLRQHKFRLVRQNKHYVYQEPEGRLLVVSKTPSDRRAYSNMVSNIKQIMRNPVPSSEALEESRQKKELEAEIVLAAQQKKKAGASRPNGKSKGNGFYYDDVPKVFVPDEVKEQARNDKAWDGLIRHVRKQRKEMERRLRSMLQFAFVVAVVEVARLRLAVNIKSGRKSRSEYLPAMRRKEERKRVLGEWVAHVGSYFSPHDDDAENLLAYLMGDFSAGQLNLLVFDNEEISEEFAELIESRMFLLAFAFWDAADFYRKPSWMPELPCLPSIEEEQRMREKIREMGSSPGSRSMVRALAVAIDGFNHTENVRPLPPELKELLPLAEKVLRQARAKAKAKSVMATAAAA